ncbi:restriction endonuclease subunit S [Mycolicibacterium goodii]|uniref:restriction endonuclease subunit S n=1 Tax=Mycolicibacterium goodii TaxID=134601 RepID=UPI001BDBF7BF|nr:restriction endonuclease subunit S [Mycolicibacterium goodii]MBU8807278.1 restriction endonuclease subunit S [Mycolicibacterium goodii]
MIKTYASYAESGHEWMGRIPAHWRLAPLGTLFNERAQQVSDTDFEPLSVTKNGVVPQMEAVAKTENNDNRKLVRAGDFVINSRSDRKGSSGISDRDGSVSVICIVLTPRTSVYGRFIHHLLRSRAFQEEFYRWGSGIVADLWSTRYSSMKRIQLPVPPMSEQRAIADFLDRETARIDTLIAEQQKLIELLQERRDAVVEAALRPRRGWDRVPLKFLLSGVDQGVSPQAEAGLAADPEAWGVLKSGCVNRGIFRQEEHKRLDSAFNVDPRIAVTIGDLLVSRASGSPDLVGSAALVESLDYRLILSDKLFRLRLRPEVSPRFMYWFLNSRHYRVQVRMAISGADGLANNLPLSSLRAFDVSVPPIDEQCCIANHLDEQTAKLDRLIAESERFIELARERRAALITAAVTGQIDLREVA